MNKISIEILGLSQKIIPKIINEKGKIESLGITTGMDIISDYLKYGEPGLAFEHLEYIVTETDFKLSSEESKTFALIAKKLGLNEN